MKKYVFDSNTLLFYFLGDKKGEDIIKIFEEAINNKAELYMSVITWGDIYTTVMKKYGKDKAELLRNTLEKYPINIEIVDKNLGYIAAKYKAEYNIDYYTALNIALTKIKRAYLVTNNNIFSQFEEELKIKWL